MALKKTYSNGKKVYARIVRIVLGKRWSPETVVEIFDLAEDGTMTFLHELQFIIDRQDENAAGFQPSALDPSGVNPYAVAYQKLKETVTLFADFEDA